MNESETDETDHNFSIYYKFNKFNCARASAPCLVTAASGALKPNALGFVLQSRLAATGSQRLAATLGDGSDASRGYGVVAVNGSDPAVRKVSAFIAGSSAANGGVFPARLKVANWPCTNQMSTLTLTKAEDSVASDGAAPALATTQVKGAVRGDGFFHAYQNNTAFGPLPVGQSGLADDAYVALVTLECGDTTGGIVSAAAGPGSITNMVSPAGAAPANAALDAGTAGAVGAAAVVALVGAAVLVVRRRRASEHAAHAAPSDETRDKL